MKIPIIVDAATGNITDTGGDVSPLCQQCPLPCCRYDDPVGYALWRRQQRDAVAAAAMGQPTARQRGERIMQVALELGVTPRTVWRRMQRERERKEGE